MGGYDKTYMIYMEREREIIYISYIYENIINKSRYYIKLTYTSKEHFKNKECEPQACDFDLGEGLALKAAHCPLL